MSKNPLYANEIATVNIFIIENYDFLEISAEIRKRKDLIHSDRWSLIYDYMPDLLSGGLDYERNYRNSAIRMGI